MDVYTENLDGNRNYEINASNIIFEIKQPKVFTISRAEAKIMEKIISKRK